jgi:hypothetical protein
VLPARNLSLRSRALGPGNSHWISRAAAASYATCHNLAGNSEFKFYQSGAGEPPALRTWFYPGDPVGLEFKARNGSATVMPANGMTATASNVPTN